VESGWKERVEVEVEVEVEMVDGSDELTVRASFLEGLDGAEGRKALSSFLDLDLQDVGFLIRSSLAHERWEESDFLHLFHVSDQHPLFSSDPYLMRQEEAAVPPKADSLMLVRV